MNEKALLSIEIEEAVLNAASRVLNAQGTSVEDAISNMLREIAAADDGIITAPADNLNWQFIQSAEGTATITGINALTELTGEIAIPSQIEGIDVMGLSKKFFYEQKKVSSVSLPDSITSIGDAAFCICNALQSINFPSNLKEIPPDCFNECGFIELDIPDSIERIRRGAFVNNRNLRRISLPAGISEIELMTFSGCESLESIVIPDGVTRINDGAFSGCYSLEKVTFPDSLKSVGTMAFLSCKNLKEVELPKTTTQIGSLAFPEGTTIKYR